MRKRARKRRPLQMSMPACSRCPQFLLATVFEQCRTSGTSAKAGSMSVRSASAEWKFNETTHPSGSRLTKLSSSSPTHLSSFVYKLGNGIE